MINNHHHKREQKVKQWSQISTESHFWLTAASHKSDGFNKLLLVFTLFIYLFISQVCFIWIEEDMYLLKIMKQEPQYQEA